MTNSKNSLQDELPGRNTAHIRQCLYWTTTFFNLSENKFPEKKGGHCHNDPCMAPGTKKKTLAGTSILFCFPGIIPTPDNASLIVAGKNLRSPTLVQLRVHSSPSYRLSQNASHRPAPQSQEHRNRQISSPRNYGRSLGKGLLTTWMAVRF